MQIEHSNEIDLIRQTLAGDTSAFDRLVKAYRHTIYVSVLSYISNPADAEDLTQRIFIRAYERLATLRDWGCFLPWLQQIAHNACKDWLRRQSGSTTNLEAVNDADFSETAPSPEEIALKREIEAVVREAIGELPETDRKLVEGRYVEGASYDELQAESGLSYAAIANRLKRAKQKIRRRVEKLLGGMMILPGHTLISGGIETVKLSVKTKLVAVGVTALIGIGGGVWYHQIKSNSVVVNEQGALETESVQTEWSMLQERLKVQQAQLQNGTVMLILQRDASSAKPKFLYLVALLDDKTRSEMYFVPPNLSSVSKEGIDTIFQGTPARLVVQHSDDYYLINDRNDGKSFYKKSGTFSHLITYYRFLNRGIVSLGRRHVQIQKSDAPAPYAGVKFRYPGIYHLSKDTVQRVEFTGEIWLDPEHDDICIRVAGTSPDVRSDSQKGEDAPSFVLYLSWQAEVKAFGRSHDIWYPKIVITKEEMTGFASLQDLQEGRWEVQLQEDRWEVLGFRTHLYLPSSIFPNSPKQKVNSAWRQVSKWLLLNLPQQPFDKIKEEK